MAAKNVAIKRHELKTINVPEKMSLRDAAKHLQRLHESECEMVRIRRSISAWPQEVALAIAEECEHLYGWSLAAGAESMFGKEAGRMLALTVSPGEVISVPWGKIITPALTGDEYLEVDAYGDEDGPRVIVCGYVMQKNREDVEALLEGVEARIRDQSMYRGKVIRVAFPFMRGRDFNMDKHAPEMIAPAPVAWDDVVLGSNQSAVDLAIRLPILNHERLADAGLPTRRGVLLAGPYGCGKSMTCAALMSDAAAHNWSVIIIDEARDLLPGLEFAQRLGRAVVIVEDLDRITSADSDSQRSHELDGILNAVDGAATKDSEVMLIATTNDAEAIHPAMLRPGRLDHIITYVPCDADMVKSLIASVAPDHIDQAQEIGSHVAGLSLTPATVVATLRDALTLGLLSGTPATLEQVLELFGNRASHTALCAPRDADGRSDIERAADRLVSGFLAVDPLAI